MCRYKAIFWFNFFAMTSNIIIFAAGGWWVNAFCAVISAAVTGYCQWNNRIMISDNQ